MTSSKNLCSVDELKERLDNADTRLRVLDSSWYLPSDTIDTRDQFNKQHIPTAAFFHIDTVCDEQSELPHMLPSAKKFAAEVEALGVSNENDVVVYDSAGLFSAARVWWMFKVFGHNSVRVLDGGLPAWIAHGGSLNSKTDSRPQRGKYQAKLDSKRVTSKADLLENCDSHRCVVLDARSTARFLGEAPEPRPGLPSGHMPQSVSLPFSELISDGHLKPPQQLREIFKNLGVDSSTKIVTSCGSGVTASIISLALAEAGLGLHSLYDGSWVEWASSDDTIILP